MKVSVAIPAYEYYSLSTTVTPEQIQKEFNYCHSKYNL